MLKTAARLLLLRVLPRRILPVVTIVEALLLVRSVRRKSRAKVNSPSASRAAPPMPLDRGARPATPPARSVASESPPPA